MENTCKYFKLINGHTYEPHSCSKRERISIMHARRERGVPEYYCVNCQAVVEVDRITAPLCPYCDTSLSNL